jgi:hypothetical protein
LNEVIVGLGADEAKPVDVEGDQYIDSTGSNEGVDAVSALDCCEGKGS